MIAGSQLSYDPLNLVVIGIEDGYFPFFAKSMRLKAPLVAVKFVGFTPVDAEARWITVDGLDATSTARELLDTLTRRPPRPSYVMMSSVSCAGFNVINPIELLEAFKIPVIIATAKPPRIDRVARALMRHFDDWRLRLSVFIEVSRRTRVQRVVKGDSKFYVQALGLPVSEAVSVCVAMTMYGGLPEPLRLSKLVASAISRFYYARLWPSEQ